MAAHVFMQAGSALSLVQLDLSRCGLCGKAATELARR